MGSALTPLVAACAALALCACAAERGAIGEPDARLAQVVHESAVRAALGRPGTAACRLFFVGIAERDWVRGSVVDSSGRAIGVRIDDAGRFPHIIQNTPIEPGAVLWAAPSAWTPCV